MMKIDDEIDVKLVCVHRESGGCCEQIMWQNNTKHDVKSRTHTTAASSAPMPITTEHCCCCCCDIERFFVCAYVWYKNIYAIIIHTNEYSYHIYQVVFEYQVYIYVFMYSYIQTVLFFGHRGMSKDTPLVSVNVSTMSILTSMQTVLTFPVECGNNYTYLVPCGAYMYYMVQQQPYIRRMRYRRFFGKLKISLNKKINAGERTNERTHERTNERTNHAATKRPSLCANIKNSKSVW